MASEQKIPLHTYDHEALRLTIPCFILGILSVVLRFAAKFKNNSPFGLDDWALLLTFLFFTGVNAALIENIRLGVYGVPFDDMPQDVLLAYSKGAYASHTMAATSMTFAKFSVLALYWRLFPTRWLHRAVIAMAIISAAYCIGTVTALLFRCIHPIAESWNPSIQGGKCFSFPRFLLAEEPFNMATNLVIVFMPIPVVLKLQMPLVRKLQICFVFAFGSCASLVSAIRIGLVAKDPQAIYRPAAENWLFIQTTLECIGCSLPTYGPLINRTFVTAGLKGFFTSVPTPQPSYWIRSNGTQRLDSVVDASKYPRSESEDRICAIDARAGVDADVHSIKDIPLNAIKVKRTVEMV
ncbi:hypothetical protein EV356DRAFT_519819 [Viridothelium virens]|uniref:Rhodopsin domain-containing protein n=1 Tax=Viridothelium virens TaxID=1048519 RepID=A0A6A6GY41_VIRVR|nr:hypothetical protein EV356DRAFT_519819 [Viridothelium virens]